MHKTTRREFIKRSAQYGMSLWLVAHSWSPTYAQNDKLNIGIIACGGRGWGNIDGVSTENIVAVCDVDENPLSEAAKRFPRAYRYVDFRQMLDERHREIDAVVITTPDHTHAVAAMAAMQLRKHVYCEKPLTHSVYEARKLAEAAKRYKVVTQMGNNGHASDGLRRAVEILRSGVIGPIREVHASTDRPIWPQGIDRPKDTPPVPRNLHWDLWLGPAPERPYHPAYHPFAWRGWWDFGTGALGDMGCHILDTAFWALDLGYPTSVEAEGEPHHRETCPKWSIVRYEFPARKGMPPVTLYWYDGGKLPPKELAPEINIEPNCTLFIGEYGRAWVPHGGEPVLLPREKFEGYQPPQPTIPRAPRGHHQEWIDACKGRGKAMSDFEYAAKLTEVVLLGNVAFRTGHRINYDARNMRAKNCAEAERYIRREYRKGWSL
jgi:predicted dehydrogenase